MVLYRRMPFAFLAELQRKVRSSALHLQRGLADLIISATLQFTEQHSSDLVTSSAPYGLGEFEPELSKVRRDVSGTCVSQTGPDHSRLLSS